MYLSRGSALWFFIVASFFLGSPLYGQVDPDSLYLRFTWAYDKLDADEISRLYTEQAEVLNLYDGDRSNSIRGRAAVQNYFSDFFKAVRDSGHHLKLTFRIADRSFTKDGHVLDNGFYMLELLRPGKASLTSFGKFSTVLELSEGRFRFKTDATTNADFLDFENSGGKWIPEREELLFAPYYDDLLGDYVSEDGTVTVIGRSQVRLFAYKEADHAFRGLNKVNASVWTAGNRVRDDQAVETFSFNKDTLNIKRADGSRSMAIKKSLYKTEKLGYPNANGALISGTLFIPLASNHKAIVLVHGSGPQDRNGYASYIRLLADVLARNGVTVLTYDKRGVAGSEGDAATASFAMLSQDALAGIRYLRGRTDLGLQKIGLGGSSQAGWVIAKAIAQEEALVDFALAIGAAGSGISVKEQNLYNTETTMRCNGYSQERISKALKQQLLFFNFLADRSTAGQLDKYTRNLQKDSTLRDWLFPLSTEVDLKRRDQWFTALELDFDPLPIWKTFNKPVLMTFSSFDDSTPSGKVKAKVDALGKTTIRTVMFNNAQHLGLEASSVCAGELVYVSRFSPGFFDLLVQWLSGL